MKFTEFVRKNQNVITGTRSTRISESIPISEAREKFYSDEQFTKYDVVESEGKKLRILEKCSNYYACVDESGNVVRKFAKALTLTEDTGSMWTDSPNPFSFHGYTPSETFQENKELRQEWFSKMSQLDENTDDIALLKELKEADKKVPMETDYKLRDKLTIAKLIADAVGIPHDPLSTPENLVNAAIRKARKDPALMRNKAVLTNMLEIAKSVGIKFSDTTFEVKKEVTEDVLNEDPLNAWKNRMKAAGAVHYISGKHVSGTTASKLHAYKIVDGKKVKVGAFDQVGRRGIAEDTDTFKSIHDKEVESNASEHGKPKHITHKYDSMSDSHTSTLHYDHSMVKINTQKYGNKYGHNVSVMKHAIKEDTVDESLTKEYHHRMYLRAIKIGDGALAKHHAQIRDSLKEDTLDELNIDTVKSYSEKAKTAPAKSLDKAIKRFGGQERAQDRIHTDEMKKMKARLKESEDLEESARYHMDDIAVGGTVIYKTSNGIHKMSKVRSKGHAFDLHLHDGSKIQSHTVRSTDASDWNRFKDLKESEELVEKFGVFRKGGSIGDNKQVTPVKVHDTAEDAKAHAKRLNKLLSPGEKNYYGMKYHTKPVSEELEPLTLKSLRKKMEMDVPAPDENNYAAKNKEMMGGEPTEVTPDMPDDNTGMTPDAISFRDIVKKLNATMVPKSEVSTATDKLPHGNAMNPTSDTHRKQLIRKLQGN